MALKEHKCGRCGRRFMFSSDLKKHLKTCGMVSLDNFEENSEKTTNKTP